MLGPFRSFARAAQAIRQDPCALLQVRGTCGGGLAPYATSAKTRLPTRLASQSSAPRALDRVLVTPKKTPTFGQASHLGNHGNSSGFDSASGALVLRRLLNTTAAASQSDEAAEAAQACEDVLWYYKGDPKPGK